MRDRSGAGLLPVGWPCSAFMTWAANLHRWRLSSSFSPISLSSLDSLTLPGIVSGCWAENGGPGSVAASCGDWLSALGLAMICGRLLLLWPSLLLTLPASLRFSSPLLLLLSCCLYGLRRSAAAALLSFYSGPVLSLALPCCWCWALWCCLRVPGRALYGSSYCTIQGAVFRLFFLSFVRLATHKIIDFCVDFW